MSLPRKNAWNCFQKQERLSLGENFNIQEAKEKYKNVSKELKEQMRGENSDEKIVKRKDVHCSPKKFINEIKSLSDERQTLLSSWVSKSPFFGLLKMKPDIMESKFVTLLMDHVKTSNNSIEINGAEHIMKKEDFVDIMDVKNGVCSDFNYEASGELLDKFAENEGKKNKDGTIVKIPYISRKKVLEMLRVGDEKDAKRAYDLLALLRVILPSSRQKLSVKYLYVIDHVEELQWASCAFTTMMQNISTYQKDKAHSQSQIGGCLLFLQLFYIKAVSPPASSPFLHSVTKDTVIKVFNDYKKVPLMRVKRPIQTVQNDTTANKMAKLDVPTAPKPSPSDVTHQISREEVHIDATTKKMEILEAVMQLPETIPEEKSMLEAKLKMQDEVIAKQKEMFEAKLKKQDEVIAKQKEMFEAKIQMQDEVNEKQQAMFDLKMRMQDDVIAKQKTMFVAQIQMQDKVIAEQKAMFEARIEIQDNVIVEQKEKLQIQEEVIAKQKAMFEVKTQTVKAAKLQHEKLISLIIKSKIAELKVKLERGNPDHEVVRSTGIDIKSVMDLIPESLRVNLEARFSSMYEGFKSLFLTHIDDSQWEKIECELKKECMGFLE